MLIKTLFKEFIPELESQIELLEQRNYSLTYARSVDWLQFYYFASTMLITIRKIKPSLEVSPTTLASLTKFLAMRWDLLSPYLNNTFLGSDLFLKLATLLAKFIPIPRYQLLMPTIKIKYNDITCTDLNDPALQLHHFILSNDSHHIIEIFDCLQLAEEDAILKHPVIFPGIKRQAGIAKGTKRLLPNEFHRLLNTSQEADSYHAAILQRHKIKLYGKSIGAHVNRLIKALNMGSTQHRGTEFEADEIANLGIAAFAAFLDILDSSELQMLVELRAYDRPDMKTFECYWQRLVNPLVEEETGELSEIHCVGLVADGIALILETHKELYNLFAKKDLQTVWEYSRAEHQIEIARKALQEKLKAPHRHLQCNINYTEKNQLLLSILIDAIKSNHRHFLEIFKHAIQNSHQLHKYLFEAVDIQNLQTEEQIEKVNYVFYTEPGKTNKHHPQTMKPISFFTKPKASTYAQPESYKDILVRGMNRKAGLSR